MKRSGPLRRLTPMPRPATGLQRSPLKAGKSVLRSVKRINPVSRKQRAKIVVRAKLRKGLVAERGPWCEVRSPVCTGREQGLHHLRKKSQMGADTRENCLLSCNPCNTWIEDAPAWAEARGLVVKSWESGRRSA